MGRYSCTLWSGRGSIVAHIVAHCGLDGPALLAGWRCYLFLSLIVAEILFSTCQVKAAQYLDNDLIARLTKVNYIPTLDDVKLMRRELCTKQAYTLAHTNECDLHFQLLAPNAMNTPVFETMLGNTSVRHKLRTLFIR